MASRVWRQRFGSAEVSQSQFSARRLSVGPCLGRLGAREILRTATGVGLNGRARHGAVRTEHATIAWQRFQPLAASFAVIEELARVGRHGLGCPMPTPGTSQCRFLDHLAFFRLSPYGTATPAPYSRHRCEWLCAFSPEFRCRRCVLTRNGCASRHSPCSWSTELVHRISKAIT
jgi:hypothetical protein